jgi:hypothetical protein
MQRTNFRVSTCDASLAFFHWAFVVNCLVCPPHTARAGVALHLFWVAVLLAVEILGGRNVSILQLCNLYYQSVDFVIQTWTGELILALQEQ